MDRVSSRQDAVCPNGPTVVDPMLAPACGAHGHRHVPHSAIADAPRVVAPVLVAAIARIRLPASLIAEAPNSQPTSDRAAGSARPFFVPESFMHDWLPATACPASPLPLRKRLLSILAAVLTAMTAVPVASAETAPPPGGYIDPSDCPDTRYEPLPPGAIAANRGLVPPLKDRNAPGQQAATIAVRGFRVTGVATHPDLGITPAGIQAIADAEYAKFVATQGDAGVKLGFADMQAVAATITEAYKSAGFILSRAFLPAQSIGDDKIVRIDVVEGRLANVIVKGNRRYPASTIAEPIRPLRDRPLIKSDVETALLYADDLPGVTVTSTFQPGRDTGDTDLVLLANEDARPLQFSIGGNNFGTEFTGRYRAQAGIQWNSPFGLGDTFNGLFEYGLDPSNNIFGTASYRLPVQRVRGLSSVVGYSRNQLQINNGQFQQLSITGPASNYYGGFDWKFVNTPDLKATGSLLLLYENSKLSSAAGLISNDRFTVANARFSLNRTDKRFKGVDIVDIGIRKSINDRSIDTQFADNDSSFVLGTLSYTRLQFLTTDQRLIVKAVGQYTGDALIPIEQFGVGGPDSVRAYPVVDVLNDRGVYGALEYHVNAPGFGDVISPFYGRPWAELLEFELFGDWARSEAAGQHRTANVSNADTRSGVGGGVLFRLPRLYQMQLHLSGAVPLSNAQSSDGDDFHIYGQIGFTF